MGEKYLVITQYLFYLKSPVNYLIYETITTYSCAYFIEGSVTAQDNRAKEGVFMMTEGMPKYLGGESEVMKFIWSNLRYPSYSENSIPTNSFCIVAFMLDYRGKVSDVAIIKSLDKKFDKEIIRVIECMTDWITLDSTEYTPPSAFTLPMRICFR